VITNGSLVKKPFLTVFVASEGKETVGNGSRKHFVELDHRAEASVLMRSLRVIRHTLELEVDLRTERLFSSFDSERNALFALRAHCGRDARDPRNCRRGWQPLLLQRTS